MRGPKPTAEQGRVRPYGLHKAVLSSLDLRLVVRLRDRPLLLRLHGAGEDGSGEEEGAAAADKCACRLLQTFLPTDGLIPDAAGLQIVSRRHALRHPAGGKGPEDVVIQPLGTDHALQPADADRLFPAGGRLLLDGKVRAALKEGADALPGQGTLHRGGLTGMMGRMDGNSGHFGASSRCCCHGKYGKERDGLC